MADNAPETTASDTVLTGGFTPQESAAPAESDGHATTQEESTWFSAYSEDTQSLITNRGYDKLNQNEAFEDLSNGYKNLQSKLGGSHDELFKITSDMGDEDWSKVYSAMGRPETADNYSYETLDTDNAELVQTFKEASHGLGLTDSQVSKLIPQLNEKIVSIAEAQQSEINAKNNTGLESLQKEWAGSWDQKVGIATRAAEHFGISEDIQKAVVASGNSAAFLKSLNQIGSLMAEGSMVGMSATDQKASIGAMSKGEAQAQLGKMQGDPDFRARLNSSDRKVAEQASLEMEKYYKILAG